MEIAEQMKIWSEAYYNGSPLISNEEYDAIETVHGQIISGAGDVPHAFRMYSLKKHYDKDGNPPLTNAGLIKTVKLDGAAVAITYINGKIARALTRGDGITGKDISRNIMTLNVPFKIDTNLPLVQVTGEVVALKSMENSRNYASGALKQLDADSFAQRKTDGHMVFVAYNMQADASGWGKNDTYLEDLTEMRDTFLFHTVDMYEHTDLYPMDGTVYRTNSNATFNKLGFTDKFPRGAYAHKEEQEFVTTELLDVVWQTGGSGKVTPVAILREVNINGANVARATLNNIEFIEGLDLELGCTVKIIRAGEIIPKIIGRIWNT